MSIPHEYWLYAITQTVNTAARMESNGARDKIHCSAETATLLLEAGKAWTNPREDLVHAKGKGMLQTYWVELQKKASQSGHTGSTSSGDETSRLNPSDLDDDKWIDVSLGPRKRKVQLDEKEQRLVDWNTDVLCRLLKQVVARNNAAGSSKCIRRPDSIAPAQCSRTMVIDEVVEMIELPELDVTAHASMASYEQIVLDEQVIEQIRDYICTIASLYRKNYFHNFEHVSQSVIDV
jgi:Adenylate and Guanylate cyclase catalytic domain